MSNPYFRFKQFTVWHDKCAMKVGTDAALLGAWTPVHNAMQVLDIGTGTGVVALMLAQRCPVNAHIVAIEIDNAAANQAKENVRLSSWHDRIEVLQCDFTTYHSSIKFDTIVSNPPYFIDSLHCPDQQRNMARHNHALTYDRLLDKVADLLAEEGLFTLIIPTDVADAVKSIAQKRNLYTAHQLNVKTRIDKAPKRTILSFSFQRNDCIYDELIIENAPKQYSEKFIALMQAYYLYL